MNDLKHDSFINCFSIIIYLNLSKPIHYLLYQPPPNFPPTLHMTLTSTQLSLSQLNQQITSILTPFTNNITSYFHQIHYLLQSFELYLETLNRSSPKPYSTILRPQNHHCILFSDHITLNQLVQFERVVHQFISWQFSFSQHFQNLILSTQSLQFKPSDQPFFTQVNIKQIIFLIYIGLQIQRKQLLGKDFHFLTQNKTSLLKEVTQILHDYFQHQDQDYQDLQSLTSNTFFVNEDKLIQKIQQKTYKLKLIKQNFSFSPLFPYSPKKQQQRRQKSIDKSICQIIQKPNSVEKNQSLISVKSEFEESRFFEEKPERKKIDLEAEKIRQEINKRNSLNMNSTNEEIFKNISLSK